MHESEPVHPLTRWENSESIQESLKAFFPVCGMILFRPVEFFRRSSSSCGLSLKKRLIKALFFAFLLGYLKLFLDVINFYWFFSLAQTGLASPSQRILATFLDSLFSSPLFFFRPVLAFFLTIGIMAAGVKLVLGFREPVAPILFIVSYKAAADLFYCLPFVGGIFATVWSLALLFVGVRQAYHVHSLRAVLAAVVMPVSLLLFIFLSMGPFFQRAITAFYPEVKSQMERVNETTAYVYMQSIAQALNEYKKELGFYPPNLDALKRYLSSGVPGEVTRSEPFGGYVYSYKRRSEAGFEFTAKPLPETGAGRFGFFADESGVIRLGGPDGRNIDGVKALESLTMDALKSS